MVEPSGQGVGRSRFWGMCEPIFPTSENPKVWSSLLRYSRGSLVTHRTTSIQRCTCTMSWSLAQELKTGIQTHCIAGLHQVDIVPSLPLCVCPELYFLFTNQRPTCFTGCSSSSSQVDGSLPRSIGHHEGLCSPLKNQETPHHSPCFECTHKSTVFLCPYLSQYVITVLTLDLWVLHSLQKAYTCHKVDGSWDKPDLNTNPGKWRLWPRVRLGRRIHSVRTVQPAIAGLENTGGDLRPSTDTRMETKTSVQPPSKTQFLSISWWSKTKITKKKQQNKTYCQSLWKETQPCHIVLRSSFYWSEIWDNQFVFF